MQLQRNPFFANPALGAGLSNLAAVFAPNPERIAARERADLLRAQADLMRMRGKGMARQWEGQDALADVFRQGIGGAPRAADGPAPVPAPDDGGAAARAAGWGDVFAAAARAGQLGAVRQVAGVYGASQGVPEPELGRLVVGAGGDWGDTESGVRFREGTRAATAQRGQDQAAAHRAATLDDMKRRREAAEARRAAEAEAEAARRDAVLGEMRRRREAHEARQRGPSPAPFLAVP